MVPKVKGGEGGRVGGQENTWDVVWRTELQERQLGLSARPILSLYERREEQWPKRSWQRRVRWPRGREVDVVTEMGRI